MADLARTRNVGRRQPVKAPSHGVEPFLPQITHVGERVPPLRQFHLKVREGFHSRGNREGIGVRPVRAFIQQRQHAVAVRDALLLHQRVQHGQAGEHGPTGNHLRPRKPVRLRSHLGQFVQIGPAHEMFDVDPLHFGPPFYLFGRLGRLGRKM
ncbi:MAG: hypothetical protein B7X99_10045 [Rhizobiales bacterium 17-65-6]|nr:MAG: hypothetical protein B7X99_10045 [Rhizobiales bacterium 17-65-6]